MDFDVLNRIADLAKRCVLSQDTTELWEVLAPQCELKGFQDESGEIFEASALGNAPQKSVKGSVLVGLCTSRIFAWLSRGPCVAQPTAECEVKRRKIAMPQQQAAATPRRAKAMLAEAPEDDPTLLSTVVVTYGRPAFQFVDTMYVSDEGFVALIVRKLAEPPQQDPQAQLAYTSERSSFFFKPKQTVNAPVNRIPVLDFTFAGVVDPADMLRLAPATGKRHTFAPLEVKKELDAAHRDFQAGGARGPKKQLIKARNREGEEEAYEFAIDTDTGRQGPTILDNQRPDPKREEDEKLRRLAAELGGKYVAEAVRVSSNSITDGTSVVKVLRNLVADFYLTISWLDLSCNRLQVVPKQIHCLPLTTLYLHSNNISDWSELDKLTSLKRLTSITVFGNPLAASPDYKHALLGLLLSVPDKQASLKMIDFVALSQVDRELTDQHLKRVNKKSSSRSLPSTPRR